MNENHELKKMREGYGDAVIDLAQKDEKIVFVGADSGGHERKWFFENAKERLIETGIAEANSAVIAGALASDGFKPFVLNFAYLHARMYNQISQSIAEDNYPVRMAGYYAGIWGFGGRSHNCITDLAFMRALPNFNVFAASTVRLIGGPVLAMLLVPYFDLEGMERSTGILQAAMPSAVLTSIIAIEYKLIPEFITTTVLFSTLYSILTLTVFLTFI